MRNVEKINVGWSRQNSNDKQQEQQAMVILLDPEAFELAYRMTNELKLAGIGVWLVDEKLDMDEQLITATEIGIRFVIFISLDDSLSDQVKLKDMLNQHVNVMPMDQAIYCIERIYPPAAFT